MPVRLQPRHLKMLHLSHKESLPNFLMLLVQDYANEFVPPKSRMAQIRKPTIRDNYVHLTCLTTISLAHMNITLFSHVGQFYDRGKCQLNFVGSLEQIIIRLLFIHLGWHLEI